MGAGIQREDEKRKWGSNGEEERKKLQWVRGRDGASGKTEGGEKWRPRWFMKCVAIRGVGGGREDNLNDLNKAWYGQGSMKETGDLKWSWLIQGKTWWRWLHLTIGFELFFHWEQCCVDPAALDGNRKLHNGCRCWIIVFSGRKGISMVKSSTNRGLM